MCVRIGMLTCTWYNIQKVWKDKQEKEVSFFLMKVKEESEKVSLKLNIQKTALGQPRGMVRGGRREEGSGWGTRVYLWRIHVDIQWTPRTDLL